MTASLSAIANVLCHCLAGLLLCSARSDAAIALSKNLAKNLIEMTEVSDVAISGLLIFLGYTVQYIASAGVFELTHPYGVLSSQLSPAQLTKRRNQVLSELYLGVGALLSVVAVTIFWMAYVEPHIWTYNYFTTHDYNVWWFLISIPAYLFVFDAWFYATHRLLHESTYLWNAVHREHHAFKEPSAFAQDAVHPFEAILQGPLGHFLPTLFLPIHPVALALFGFLSSVFAVAAHDGRQWDLNNHYYHHCAGKGRVNSFNYSLYWPLWDVVFNTRYNGPDMDKQAILKNHKQE